MEKGSVVHANSENNEGKALIEILRTKLLLVWDTELIIISIEEIDDEPQDAHGVQPIPPRTTHVKPLGDGNQVLEVSDRALVLVQAS